MKVIRAFCLCWLLMLADGVSAQLVDKVLSVLGEDSVGSVTVARTDSDSIQLSLVRQELETARLNEANLRMEMEQMKLAGYAADSVKLALQKQRIDSLRTVTPGIPVVVEKDTLFYLYAKRGGHTPQQRAKDVSNVIEALGTRFNLRPDSVYLESTDIVTDLMYGEKVIISFTDQDALWENCTLDLLACTEVKKRSISYYAGKLCVTPKYLSTVCKKVSGKTAFEWINDYVVEDIKYFLKYSNKSIKEISEHQDFPNISFFGKYVKTHLGTSPTDYRKQSLPPRGTLQQKRRS